MLTRLFQHFESLISPTGPVPLYPPPERMWGFFRYFLSQHRRVIVRLFVGGLLVAVLDASIPIFIGRVTKLMSNNQPDTLLSAAWPQLMAMATIVFGLRPAAILLQTLLVNQAVGPGLTTHVRWQSHWHVMRQSWTYFQNDFAGRIATRVMQTGNAMRDVLLMFVDAAWYIVVYGAVAFSVLLTIDVRLASLVLCWFSAYALLLYITIPRLRKTARKVSETRSSLTGLIVDNYTNILIVKLFARAKEEDSLVQNLMKQHAINYQKQTRTMTEWIAWLTFLNAALLASMAGTAIVLWTQKRITLASVTTALPLAWQLTGMAGWVGRSITSMSDSIGLVQDGMKSIAVPQSNLDSIDAIDLRITKGQVIFKNVSFGYNAGRDVLRDIELQIRSGERVGLVGQSGAGKSTLINLLLGFYKPEKGRIFIDGSDITRVTQDSLRARIAVVTQDTSLLHRSIADNISYGSSTATHAEIEHAAKRAHAADFIAELEDWQGRRGYDAHVGERGVKLSGGQRQRIAIARLIMKDAPILVLDEATSALDSEIEAVIQEELEELMKGRTVIAIAHRLSTIAQMDRIVMLEDGRITEQGTHAELLARGGAYARVWTRQSRGFESVRRNHMI